MQQLAGAEGVVDDAEQIDAGQLECAFVVGDFTIGQQHIVPVEGGGIETGEVDLKGAVQRGVAHHV